MYNNLYKTGGDKMEAITYTAARQNLAKTMEKVCRDRAPVIVTRKASNSVVIMSLRTLASDLVLPQIWLNK